MVTRTFGDAFILNLGPLFVVVALLFLVLFNTTKDAQKTRLYGFTLAGSTGAVSALLVVVILGHIQLRESLASAKIVYLEQYDFVIDLAILMIPRNIFLFSFDITKGPLRFRHFEHNLVPQLAYFLS